MKMKTGNENNSVVWNSLTGRMKFKKMLNKNCFSKRCVLFIIRPIGFYFSIFKFKFI